MNTTPHNSPLQTSAEETTDIKALQRTNRVLKKQLVRSERTRAEIESSNRWREQILRKSLKDAETYSEQLSAAKAELTQLNQQLEAKIKRESEALRKATDSLQQAKVQVANSEKFSTLGELVAGVAHEINNPISCITSNIKFVHEYSEQLLAHIALQQCVLQNKNTIVASPDMLKVSDHAEEIDLDYLKEDLPALIQSMATSGSRITEISQSLRTFARADTTRKQAFNIHEGIDGTLLILRHRLKVLGARKAIAVQKAYGDFPTVSCYPGQINQVFMNVIANAIDAMDEGAKPSGPPKICIQTRLEGDFVVITITDNAGGMPETVRSRIFESQFTTKSAGKGTGLGLSIAHQIVTDTHKGRIHCDSTLGTGTTFTIMLPTA